MPRRTLAGSIIASLVWPWLVVTATALHLSWEHGHDYDLVDHVAAALHGHGHEARTVPHDHDAVPASGKSVWPPLEQIAAVIEPAGIVVPPDSGSPCPETAKRSPPQPPTASPPILRV